MYLHTRKRRSLLSFIGAAAVALVIAGASPAYASSNTPAPPSSDNESIEVFRDDGSETTISVESNKTARSAETTSLAVQGSGNLEDLTGAVVDPVVPDEVTEQYGARVIIGPDNRTKVNDPTVSPYIQMPFISYQRGGQGYICTGWLNGPHSIATAAHCMFDAGQPSTNYQVYFGLNGTTAVAACNITYTYVPEDWKTTYSPEFDWGIIQLDCNPGEVFGHLGYRTPVAADFNSASYFVTGYPGDKYANGGYTMWQASGTISGTSTAQRLFYGIDTFGGQSGAPVWRNQGGACGNCAIGIHTTGQSTQNSGSRITSTVLYYLNLFRDNYFI